jgi:hypothetical protein
MKRLICKIFGHKKKHILIKYTSLKRGHIYCPRCEERIETNVPVIGERSFAKD